MCRAILLLTLLLVVSWLHAQKINPNSHSKISYALQQDVKEGSDSINISISVKDAAIFFGRINSFRLMGFLNGNILLARVRRDHLQNLAAFPEVIFINELKIPREELTTGAYDLSLNTINLAHTAYPQLKGDSVSASVKERLFDTTDIDLKGRVFTTGLEPSGQTAHASLMTTIIAGGANSSPFALGAAPTARVSSSSFLNLFPDPDSIFQKNNIYLQNHSYGTTVENFYGNEAAAYDRQANHIPSLLHVFSAGNSGDHTNTSGPYTGVQAYANLTGNFKHAKNIITVGSIDSAGQLMPLSSKGPAYDGRVKPDLMAYGEDGSSGAAALVSGTVVLLQHQYKRMHHDSLPPSALIRAALIDAADDIGNPNPDYASGYGSLNAFKAVRTISENRYLVDSIIQSEIKIFRFEVPAGISRLKLTLAWNDPAASPNAAKALVNDIDLQLRRVATGESWLPWVLDLSSDLNSLQSPAQRKIDTLNNVEQITVDLPQQGDYDIEVKGSRMISTQSFALAYQLDTADRFCWTYPTATDHLIAGNTHWLRWESNLAGQGQIEYATNGNNWRTLATADLSKKYFKWIVPDTVATVVLRMISPSGPVLSDSFTISPQLNMQTGFNCADSFLLSWNHLPVQNYRLYELDARYLEPFQQTTDTAVLLNKAQHPSVYYSVAPLINGIEGIKSNTLNYTSQAVGCYLKAFFLQSQTESAAVFTVELGTIFNIVTLSLEKLSAGGFVSIRTISNPASTSINFADSSLRQGENQYRIKIVLRNGTVIYSNIELVYHLTEIPVILYPNPLMRGSSLKMLAKESGRYKLQIADASGRVVYNAPINRNLTLVPTGFLSSGLYLARIIDSKGKPFSQKIVVY